MKTSVVILSSRRTRGQNTARVLRVSYLARSTAREQNIFPDPTKFSTKDIKRHNKCLTKRNGEFACGWWQDEFTNSCTIADVKHPGLNHLSVE